MKNKIPEFLLLREKVFSIKNKLTKSLVFGVDESGRGPVIGPMVLVCYGIKPLNIVNLLDMKIEDSKILSSTKRENLYKHLISLSNVVRVAIIPPKKIDEWVTGGGGLNRLEASMITKLCSGLEEYALNIFIDSPSNPESFSEYLKSYGLNKFKAENRADKYRPVVSAASIVAKVLRDRVIEVFKKITAIDFGSGYLTDPKTKKAIHTLIKKYPWLIRKSWKIKI